MAGLLDFLQSASNSAASNVSGPVDLLAWALKKAGVPVGNQPMLGSAWMEQQGLTKPVPQSAMSLAGETAGLLAPIGIAAKAPQIAAWRNAVNELADSGAGRMPFASQRGAVVYHGSPHKFDKFDSSKIGTGEGVQAYGHGLYVAENPKVAEDYRQALSTWHTTLNGTALTPDHPQFAAAMHIGAQGYDGALKQAKEAKRLGLLTPDYADEEIAKIIALKDAKITAVKQGHVYKVDLPDEQIAKMLDWDKPLSQQPENVQQAMRKLGLYEVADRAQYIGRGMYDAAAGKALHSYALPRNNAKAAKKLSAVGVPGLRYLDGGSRGAGQGTSNYVVFPGNEGLLSILERNGAPLK